MIEKEKILVAMSGGVDSSVAAALLLKQGYDVTGAFMVNYDPGSQAEVSSVVKITDQSCWIPDYRDALRVAAHLGIPLLKLDFTREYERDVLKYMYREYAAGRTPNPDVLCNKYVKFGAWLKRVRELGFNKLATGHYARTKGGCLSAAKDKAKDQTYFLHQLTSEQLGQTLFPIGDYLKSEVRKLARNFKLPTAAKAESMGICFVGEVPMKEFLSKKIKFKPGKIVTTSGEIVGEHDGLAFYTIGQRHLGIEGRGQALYVVGKDAATNKLMVGLKDDPLLVRKEIKLKNLHFVGGRVRPRDVARGKLHLGEGGQTNKFPLQCKVRLRHQQPLQSAKLDEKNILHFSKPQWGVAPGQFAVLYKGDECLGGGTIA